MFIYTSSVTTGHLPWLPPDLSHQYVWTNQSAAHLRFVDGLCPNQGTQVAKDALTHVHVQKRGSLTHYVRLQ